MKKPVKTALLLGMILHLASCFMAVDSNQNMIQLLEKAYERTLDPNNSYSAVSALRYHDSVLTLNLSVADRMEFTYGRGNALLSLGREQESIRVLEELSMEMQDPYDPSTSLLMRKLAVAYLRLGERMNCLTHHNTESCIMPIRGAGVHQDRTGSSRAIQILEQILDRNPEDYECRWLLNIAYMTLGEYPGGVPAKYLIPNMDKDPEPHSFNPFTDVAPLLGIESKNLAGGVIVDDFNKDGYLDIVTSAWDLKGNMHYYKNNGRGGFIDLSRESNLAQFTGGLNITQTDYDNDGYLDIMVFRGAWMEQYGEQPNSLLRNNGDETFTDVTVESGLLSFNPTQTGVWRDFNGDGWLDLFIGNESTRPNRKYPCELYLNNRNGTFTEVAAKSGCAVIDFIKGVTAADFDNDGKEDLYLSSLKGHQLLLRNIGNKNQIPQFQNVTQAAGLDDIRTSTFPTWFWDYDNDGWQDIFVGGYYFGKSIAHTACTQAIGISNNASKTYLYRNNRNGSFTNVSKEAGLDQSIFAMGANFGDLDNDGYLDLYLATGNPEYESLVPNRLFRNNGNGRFTDLTVAAKVGNLQKGHGVAISDMDNDGDQDIFVEVGGALPGDYYHNSLYLNPGQNKNNWIHVLLEGTHTNRPAIGSQIRIRITENGKPREIFRHITSGGSFGSSSLRNDIGLGSATVIDTLTITWQQSKRTQTFTQVPTNQTIKIKEGAQRFTVLKADPIRFLGDSSKIQMCNSSVL